MKLQLKRLGLAPFALLALTLSTACLKKSEEPKTEEMAPATSVPPEGGAMAPETPALETAPGTPAQ